MDDTNMLEDWQFMNDNSFKYKPNVAAPENDCWSLKAWHEDVRTGNLKYTCDFSRREKKPIVPLKTVPTGIGCTADDPLLFMYAAPAMARRGCRVMRVG